MRCGTVSRTGLLIPSGDLEARPEPVHSRKVRTTGSCRDPPIHRD